MKARVDLLVLCVLLMALTSVLLLLLLLRVMRGASLYIGVLLAILAFTILTLPFALDQLVSFVSIGIGRSAPAIACSAASTTTGATSATASITTTRTTSTAASSGNDGIEPFTPHQ